MQLSKGNFSFDTPISVNEATEIRRYNSFFACQYSTLPQSYIKATRNGRSWSAFTQVN